MTKTAKTCPLLALVAVASAWMPQAQALDAFKQLTTTRVSVYASGGMDFDNGAGSLETYSFEAYSFLSQPISLPGSISFIPTLRYQATALRYDDTPAGFPVGDEDLHTLQLPLYFLRTAPASPWIYGAFVSPGLSTDFGHVDGDDFIFDAGIGAAYQFSDDLIVGVGLVAHDIGWDTSFIPAPGLLWNPCDNISIQLFGPSFSAKWAATQDWHFSFDVKSAGGAWNIDSDSESRMLELRSYRAGLSVQRRLTEEWWIEGGGGITFANKVELNTRDGSRLNKSALDDLDQGYYGYLAIKRSVW